MTKSYNITVCANELPYSWLGHVLRQACDLSVTVSGNHICDTIRTLTLAVNPLLTKSYNITVCANELPYTWLGHVFTQAGNLTDTESGTNGCDTIRTLTLGVNPQLAKSRNISVCADELPYTWLGHVFTPTATLTDTFPYKTLFRSIRTLTLAVNPLLTKSYNITVCANELPYTWLGHVFTQAGNLT